MYHVRRIDREIRDGNELDRIITHGRFATVGLCRDDEPYLVTMNYGYEPAARRMYFHAAPQGQKLDFIGVNPCACVTVIEDHGYATGECSHRYRSVVLRGRLTILEAPEEKTHAMDVLIRHQESEPEPVRRRFISGSDWMSGVVLLRLDIETVSGKSSL